MVYGKVRVECGHTNTHARVKRPVTDPDVDCGATSSKSEQFSQAPLWESPSHSFQSFLLLAEINLSDFSGRVCCQTKGYLQKQAHRFQSWALLKGRDHMLLIFRSKSEKRQIRDLIRKFHVIPGFQIKQSRASQPLQGLKQL